MVWSVLALQQKDGLQRLWTHLCRFGQTPNTTDVLQVYILCVCVFINNTFFNAIGEIKRGKVSGFHNWIQFYLLEKRGKMNYYSHSFNGPVSIHKTELSEISYTLISYTLYFFRPLTVDHLPWHTGDAVYVGWILQAGRLCHHWLQPRVWLCLIQPLLHHSSWKAVSTSACLAMFPWREPFFRIQIFYCFPSVGVVWA